MGVDSTRLNTFFENPGKVQIIVGQKLHTVDFADHYIVKTTCEGQGTDIEIIDLGDVKTIDELKGCNSKLNYPKVVRCLLDSFVEFDMVGESAFHALKLGHEP